VHFDLVIVGAGPAGISTAVEAREAGIGQNRILVPEKGPAHSYAIRKFYRDHKPLDAVYKGIPAISEGKITLADGSKQQTLDFLDETIRRWELNVRYDEGVGSIKKQGDLFEIITAKGGEPLLREGGETSVRGRFVAGDLTAGRNGGSIISAFNSGVAAMRVICRDYLDRPKT
jgi:thioredoxin reductase